jgi:hypothetical protein
MNLVMEAAGKPNEYNTATFIPYDNIIKPAGPFNRFFNDPEIQEILHVRGTNLPGLNFSPERISDENKRSLYEDKRGKGENTKDFYYAPIKWQVCNNDIVSI